MPIIVWTHGEDGVPFYLNRCWREYTGLELESSLAVGVLVGAPKRPHRRSPARPKRRETAGEAFEIATASPTGRQEPMALARVAPLERTRPGKSRGGWERRWTRKRSTGAIWNARSSSVRRRLGYVAGREDDASRRLPARRPAARRLVRRRPVGCSRKARTCCRGARRAVEGGACLGDWNRAPPNPSDVTGSYQVMRSRRAEYHAAGLEPHPGRRAGPD